MVRRKHTKEMLEPLVAEATSVAGVLRMLGLRPNGGAHAHISRTIKAFGIDTSHFQRYNPVSVPPRLTPDQILVRREPGRQREKPHMLKRALIESGVPYQCVMCGNTGTWRGLPLTLEVDHIDGDFYNNEAANLRFLCPNCHRLTPNFAGRGKGRFSHEGRAGNREKPSA
ncbi:HNH endonuclease signature motif containing protein [Nocardioides sp. HM23]|uniref:HNH endonuclease signature motif containing protein n=1 Tax=Nocardioides bizhenqiangii TaxID=3095076 RepID=UPI002ACA3C24|nr:HNH endonuclease signature motif containing protein [Nocardioides sp. HM23]MDZ5623407.1 HNH endonuclease signature motif containing protein [Nocardioides sp. HM23]